MISSVDILTVALPQRRRTTSLPPRLAPRCRRLHDANDFAVQLEVDFGTRQEPRFLADFYRDRNLTL
jgi:hypothetical protein